ncbi:unnamed protein product [Trichobilharzia regenti]|nr:unnamed protein product [Trichobilharzia regenti]
MTELADVVASVDVLNERLNGELDWRRLQLQSRQVYCNLLVKCDVVPLLLNT